MWDKPEFMSDRQLTGSVEFPNNGRSEFFLREEIVNDIRHLASDNKEVRKKALWDLFDLCWHQGTLYWQAAFVAPFLIERLPHESEPNLLEIIIVSLAHLATGFPSGDTSEELDWARATYGQVYKEIDVYLDLLEHSSSQVRIAAIYILAFCQRDAAMICTKLCRHFDNEPEEMVRATIPYCLAFVSDNTLVDPVFFEEILNSDDTDIVKLAAGNTLAYVAGENMPEYALSILVDLWENTNLVDRLAKHSDPMETIHYKKLLDFLTPLSDRQIAKIIPSIWQEWGEYYRDLDAIELASGNLFGSKKRLPEGTTIHDLTDSQRAVLRLIAYNTSSTGQKIYYRGKLEFIGIGTPAYQKDMSSAREKLLRFLNGEKLEYDG